MKCPRPTGGAVSLGLIGVQRKPLGPFTKRRRNAARGQERVRAGLGPGFIVWKPLILTTSLCFSRAGDVLRRRSL
jgi:hypothetical protein